MAELQPRLNNPTRVSLADVEAILARGWQPTIQFVDSTASPRLLGDVNDLAGHYGERLEVRFYGHYTETFDADVLRHLPDVAWLSVDSLTHIANTHRIAGLGRLKRLSFGAYRHDAPAILDTFPLEQLTHLSIGANLRNDIDLAPLARARGLVDLAIAGHTRGLAVVAGLPALARLDLTGLPKRQALGFLAAAPALTSLRLLLGGRADLDAFQHPGLRELSIQRVLGFADLGDLARFPALRSLEVEDQAKLPAIDLTSADLERLVVMTCKALAALPGLDRQARLAELRIAHTKLDLDPLLARDWPPTLRVLSLWSSSRRWNEAAKAQTLARGFRFFPD